MTAFYFCVNESAARQLHFDVLADFEVAHSSFSEGRIARILHGFYGDAICTYLS